MDKNIVPFRTENDPNPKEWKLWYENLEKRMNEIALRTSTTTERPSTTTSRQVDAIWRELHVTQEINAKLASDMDSLKQELTQMKEKNMSLHRLMTSCQRDLTSLQAEHFTVLEDLDLLQTEHTKLRANVTFMQKDNAKLRQQVLALESDVGEVLCDVTKIQSDITTARRMSRKENKSSQSPAEQSEFAGARPYTSRSEYLPEIITLQKQSAELSSDVSSQRRDIGKLQQEVTSVSGNYKDILVNMTYLKNDAESWINKFRSQITNLEMFMAMASSTVAFHASLSIPVTTAKTAEIIVCDNIISNVGGAYDNVTGVFTAPVPGTYCFLANTSPCQRTDDRRARLSVVMEGRKIAHVYARGLWWSTGHTVVQLLQGHKVWLRTFDDDHYTFSEGYTTFTGMLLQPMLFSPVH